MSQLIRTAAISLALLGSVGFATAQTSSVRADLSPSQERMVSQGLANTPSQTAPSGPQPQVGSKIPDSMTTSELPTNVTDQVPETKQLLFVKLPDRIVLIDPETSLVTEIIVDSATIGSNPRSGN
jgi:hypothetical protein